MTLNEAAQIVAQKKGEVLAIVQWPYDEFLFTVCVQIADEEWVVWTFNSQTSGCSNGSYFTRKEDALRQFGDRCPFVIRSNPRAY